MTYTRWPRKSWFLGLAVALVLGCGGGGGGSSTQPPMGVTINACLTDPRDARGVQGQITYRRVSGGNATIGTGANGCFSAAEADPFSVVSAVAGGYEDRANVPQTEIDRAGDKLYMVSLQEPFHTRFQQTRRVDVNGAEEGVSRWPSPCLGENLASISLKYFNLSPQQVTAVNDNSHIFTEMTNGTYSLGPAVAAVNANFETGVIKVVASSMNRAFTTWNGSAISAVVIEMPPGFINASWLNALRHEFGHGAGAIGHASNGGLMTANNPSTPRFPDQLDLDAARVGYCIPIGNRASGSSATQSLPGVGEYAIDTGVASPAMDAPAQELPQLRFFNGDRDAARQDRDRVRREVRRDGNQ